MENEEEIGRGSGLAGELWSSRYPFPWKLGFQVLWDALLLRPRSFRADALKCSHLLSQPLLIKNQENIPTRGPCLLVVNHYNQPGFGAWWIGLGVSIAVPLEIHWLMTAAWTFPNDPHLRSFTSVTYWLFKRIARIYGFTNMPPMPPDPNQTEYRAASVRQALRYARQARDPVIGITPEGRDIPEGGLGAPPAGVGRFIAHLVKRCQVIIPIGMWEQDGRFCASFGPAFGLETTPGASPDELDEQVSRQVMEALALQLPQRLRGIYGDESE